MATAKSATNQKAWFAGVASRGAGLRVPADGQEIARAPQLQRVNGRLWPAKRSTRFIGLARTNVTAAMAGTGVALTGKRAADVGPVETKANQSVPLWGLFETSVVDVKPRPNPFADVTLEATFTAPSGIWFLFTRSRPVREECRRLGGTIITPFRIN